MFASCEIDNEKNEVDD